MKQSLSQSQVVKRSPFYVIECVSLGMWGQLAAGTPMMKLKQKFNSFTPPPPTPKKNS
jgi:hypothetical protein